MCRDAVRVSLARAPAGEPNALAGAVGTVARLVHYGTAVTRPILQLADRLLLRNARRIDAGKAASLAWHRHASLLRAGCEIT